YDAADRLVEEERLDGTRIGLEYDADGHVVAVVHRPVRGDDVFHELEVQAQEGTLAQGPSARSGAAPRRTELQRDALGRLVEKRVGASVLRYRYDLAGRVVEATRWTKTLKATGESQGADAEAEAEAETLALQHTTRFEHDAMGRLVAEHTVDAVSGQAHSLRHAHDLLGNRTRTELPVVVGAAGTAGMAGQRLRRSLNYLHYGSGHLHQINLGLLTENEGSDAAGSAEAALPENVREAHRLI
ncbi:sugar-binding protein, partial [Acidovorax sp. GBBC 3334]|nr:sugar-binding protein [Acidovorax sp. GBBC 3334]